LTEKLEISNRNLQDINQHLEEKVKEQTTLLIHSEKMTTIGIMAAGVAHEINNPISYVKGNMSAISKYIPSITKLIKKYEDLSRRVQEKNQYNSQLAAIKELRKDHKIDFILEDITGLANESLEGADRIKNIVNDLSIFARVDDSELTRVNINDSLDITLNIIKNEIKYNVKIIKNYGVLPLALCFPGKISQIFMNVLVNAGQAIKEQGAITITTSHINNRQQDTEDMIEIIISDTGCGIEKQNLTKIFNPFYTTKPIGKGTGLGLSITYDLINAHGGTITAKSEIGIGSSFTIKLPISNA
jgi:two-component system, NtrC family, sensor kinase